MKILISSILLISSVALANSTPDAKGCYQKLVTVCPVKKGKPKPPLVCPKPLVVYEERVVEKEVPKPYPVPGPVRFVKVPYPVPACPICPPEPMAVVGLHMAMGIGAQDPYVSGQVGVRFTFPKAYLGFELFSALQYGIGLQGLIYVYQGPRVKVHVVDPGILVPFSNSHLLGISDIHRPLDLLLGAGVEVKLACHWALTADWRVGIPDPKYLDDHKDCKAGCDKRIDVGHAVGNAFAASQLFVGFLFHN